MRISFSLVRMLVFLIFMLVSSCSAYPDETVSSDPSGGYSAAPTGEMSTDTEAENLISKEPRWIELDIPQSRMIIEFAMAYDPVQRQVVAFGGRDENFSFVSETWAFDVETSSWRNLDPETNPPGRANHAMVYDPVRGNMLMFGGASTSRAYNDLWEYDLEKNLWVEISTMNPPEPRQMHGLVYDIEQDALILFGGRMAGGGAHFNDTWSYLIETQEWRRMETEQTPPVQDHVNLAYDAANHKTILFVGPPDRGTPVSYTWVYASKENSWTESVTGEAPLSDHSSLVYQPDAGQFLLIGNNPFENGMETWMFDYPGRTWMKFSGLTEIPYREHFSMVYMDSEDAFLVSGGFPNSGNWLLRLTD